MTDVEADGTHVRARLLGFGDAVVAERTENGIVAIRERWEPGSVTLPRERLRMLSHHDRRTPVGWWETFAEEADGIYAEGRLVGSRGVLDHLRELVRDDLLAAVSIGFVPSPDDVWSRPEQRGGLPTVTRRGVALREASIVDAAAVPGSVVLSITGQHTGPSPATAAVIAEAEAAVRGTGYVARQRVDLQAQTALALAEADRLIAAGQRWKQADDTDPDVELQPMHAPTPVAKTWQEMLDDERERAWLAGREDDARRELGELLARRQRAEAYAQREATERDAIMRTVR